MTEAGLRIARLKVPAHWGTGDGALAYEEALETAVAVAHATPPPLDGTHDVRGHYPYHEYPHPDNHMHPQLLNTVERVTAEAALADFVYEHGSDFDGTMWPGMDALRAALVQQEADHE